MTCSRSLLAVAALLGLLPVAPCAAFDERAAIEATLAGDKALAAKDVAGAEASFRAAVEADPTYLPAHQGLGEALLALGRTADARAELRIVDRTAGTLDDRPEDVRRRILAARKRLDEIDPQGKALAVLFRAHADAVAGLGERQKDLDPDLADRTVNLALALVPEHARALALRQRLAAQGLRRESLFDGKQVLTWDGGKGKWWSVVDGVIVGDAKGVATFIRTETMFEGSFDVVMEARLIQSYGAAPYFTLMGAWTEEFENSRFGVLVDVLQWDEYKGKDQKEARFHMPVGQLRKPLDPKAWNLFELRYRDGRIEAWLNGKKVSEGLRPATRKGGYVGLLVQECKAEIRRVEVVRR